jgi:hypothetical protein
MESPKVSGGKLMEKPHTCPRKTAEGEPSSPSHLDHLFGACWASEAKVMSYTVSGMVPESFVTFLVPQLFLLCFSLLLPCP